MHVDPQQLDVAHAGLKPWLELLAHGRPTPAAGTLAYACLAGCAALHAKLDRIAGLDPTVADARSARFLEAASADALDYPILTRSAESAAVAELLRTERDRAEAAVRFLEDAAQNETRYPAPVRADHLAVLGLGRAALDVLLTNLRVNGQRFGPVAGDEEFQASLRGLARRATALAGALANSRDPGSLHDSRPPSDGS